MKNTKVLADKIVDSLTIRLRGCKLPAFKSIYVAGSYCRGDWLNSSSDLDIHIINNNGGTEYREPNLKYIMSIVSEALNGQDFPSHCPGGVDYGFNNIENIPTTYEEACKPLPYAYFSTLMFDLKGNNITLYGDNINDLLPETPNPKVSACDWFLMLAERIHKYSENDFRLPFSIYKSIVAAQLHYGDVNVNKYKILELYQKNIPDIQMKWFGEAVIRNYIGTIYPERIPVQLSFSDYMSFINELRQIIKPH